MAKARAQEARNGARPDAVPERLGWRTYLLEVQGDREVARCPPTGARRTTLCDTDNHPSSRPRLPALADDTTRVSRGTDFPASQIRSCRRARLDGQG